VAYATSDEYLTAVGATVAPTGLDRVLEVASTRVDEMLVGAVYATDDDGAPTDDDVTDVVKRATIEQVVYMLEAGDTTGAGGYSSQSVGRVSWTRGAGTAGAGGSSRFGPEAVAILHVAGLLPTTVIRY
jgi:hypothetical protein